MLDEAIQDEFVYAERDRQGWLPMVDEAILNEVANAGRVRTYWIRPPMLDKAILIPE